MRKVDWRGAATALFAGFAGAALALSLNLPAAALMGSTVAVTLAAVGGLQPAVPSILRDIGFCVIGVTLGAGVSSHIFNDISRWPLSLLLLGMTVLAVMAASALVLKLFFRTDAQTALLAASPGALSYTLALASDRDADLRSVMVLQSFRLLLITIFLPPLIGFAESAPELPGSSDQNYLGYGEGAVLLLAALALGLVMARLRWPAAYLLSGLIASGVAHAAGLVDGRLADPVTFFGFSVTGAVIGARFAGIGFSELKRLSLAGLAATAAAVAVSLGGSFAASVALDLPFGQVWVSFAPGGVEGMSSMALALGYDPVYVATHHIFRILLLIMILPLALGWIARKR